MMKNKCIIKTSSATDKLDRITENKKSNFLVSN